MAEMKNFYARTHRTDARVKDTYKHVKESRIMTKLTGNILCLDLANDKSARDNAFSYATSITHARPELADRIFTAIELNEQRGKDNG